MKSERDLKGRAWVEMGLTKKEGKEEGWRSVEGKEVEAGARGGEDRRGWQCCDLAAAAA